MEKKRLDVFVDIETASTESNAAILSIAAVPFCRENKKVAFDTFYQVTNVASCFFAGMSFDKSTQEWWMVQSQEARNEILENQKNAKWITETLEMFVDYLKELSENHNLYLWAQGPDFDFRILSYAISKHLGVETPWTYNQIRDARTFILESVGSYDRLTSPVNLMKHNALEDALFGVDNILEVELILRGTKP